MNHYEKTWLCPGCKEWVSTAFCPSCGTGGSSRRSLIRGATLFCLWTSIACPVLCWGPMIFMRPREGPMSEFVGFLIFAQIAAIVAGAIATFSADKADRSYVAWRALIGIVLGSLGLLPMLLLWSLFGIH